MIQEMNIDLGYGINIYGKLYIPDKEHYPFVIMSHGLDSSYIYMEEYAVQLLEAGIGSLVFDYTGGSRNSKSGGDYLEMTIHQEVSELTRIIELCLDLDEIDTTHLYLMGESQGGLVSNMAGKVFPEIEGMILLYPALNIPDLVRKIYPDVIPEKPDLLGYEVGKKYIADAREIQVQRFIKNTKTKVLIIHGTEDPLVPVDYIQSIQGEYLDSKLVIIDGAKHEFEGKNQEIAIQEILQLINQKS